MEMELTQEEIELLETLRKYRTENPDTEALDIEVERLTEILLDPNYKPEQ